MLLSLQATSGTGRLRVENDDIARDLWLRDGRIIGADSSAPADSLEWLLFTAGVLTEDLHDTVRGLIRDGVKRGRALVESAGIRPSVLCDWTERRARFLARDLLAWKQGTFLFTEGDEPVRGHIPVDLDPREILVEAARDRLVSGTLPGRIPPADAVLEQDPGGLVHAGRLQRHERYVLSLVDGTRPVSEICFLSEIGETETLRALALLATTGNVRGAGHAQGDASADADSRQAAVGVDQEPEADRSIARPLEVPAGDSTAELRAAIRIYNDVYVFLYAYMIKEVGPIAEQLLDKTLRDVRDRHAALFHRAITCRDGSLPEDVIVRNVNLLKESRRDALLSGLYDYLLALTISVRRILGPDHEGHVARRLKEMRCAKT